jgi:hypothetical protein
MKKIIKTIRKVIIIIFLIMFVIFFSYNLFLIRVGRKEFIDKSYNGLIIDIRKVEGRRDLPDIKLNNNWMPLDEFDSKVSYYIKIGDSIVKESGTEEIKVFRKDEENEWRVRIFK